LVHFDEDLQHLRVHALGRIVRADLLATRHLADADDAARVARVAIGRRRDQAGWPMPSAGTSFSSTSTRTRSTRVSATVTMGRGRSSDTLSPA
jgi:hypothetical protein